ncbi:MAG: SprT family zinc-dependent metalloprotease [Thermoplasmata archaeon]|nr:SprT family zinc-dependent metalloprotease [Thermoplasmata archaeon]
MSRKTEINFEYTIVRSKRRTVAIHIDQGVVVRAPFRARESQITNFLIQKSPWILKKLEVVNQRAAESPHHTFQDRDTFLFQGVPHVLRLVEASKTSIEIHDMEIFLNIKPGTPPEKIPEKMKKWYIKKAREKMNQRVEYYSEKIGKKPKKIAIRGQSKRWGSCSSKGNINLNWKLIMAPEEILDYVVAHEVCHLLHPNHSNKFWHTLETIMPDYEARRNWIKQNGHKLGF